MSDRQKQQLLRTINKINTLLEKLRIEVTEKPFSDESYFYFKETKSELVQLGYEFEIFSDFDFPTLRHNESE